MKIHYAVLVCFIICIKACVMEKEAPCGWTKVFENNSDGSAAFGNKSDLVDAVRAGYPVRLGFGEKPIEHFANANFVSVIDGEIFKGEVFAQTPTIIGQMPAVENDSLFMRFRIWNHWTKMVGTNGYSSGFMTDYQLDTLVGGNEDRFRKTSWYVEYPCQLSRNKKSH